MPEKMRVFRPIKATLKTVRQPEQRGDDPRQQAINSRYWRKLRIQAIREWVALNGPYCGDCKRPLDFHSETHVDHVIPHSGINDPLFSDLANTQVLCKTCHSRKTRRDNARS